jgi:ABC-type transport system involved in multi-copper enzyme maturation permease subunit
MLFALILGILVVTWEYRHGTITQTFLATPVRERVISAKAVVAALAGAALTIPALLLMLTIAAIWIGGREGFHVGGEELGLIARLVLAAAIVGVLGLEIGAATGRQLGAIVVVFAWLVFGEHFLYFWSSTRDYLPARGVLAGILGTSHDAPPLGSSLLVAAAYVVGLGALALAVTRRRDIS